ncbi:MAG: DUF364 domain-containing protein [Actinomycetota bacterium]|nr:DUF364 domain-containing protein [Actinomycetota bacterium]
MILDELLAQLHNQIPKPPEVNRISIGDRYVAVKLGQKAGVAYRPKMDSIPIELKDGFHLAELALSNNLMERATGIATINALSWLIIPQRLKFRHGDPTECIDIQGRIITMIGFFTPLVRRFAVAQEIRVVERESFLSGEQTCPSGRRARCLSERQASKCPNVRYFTPAQVGDAVRGAHAVIITGSALVYGGIEDYLQQAKISEEVMVVGPTSSMLPDPFFRRGATAVGGIEIFDANMLMDIVESGGGTRDIIGKCARKIWFRREDFTDQLRCI